MDLLTTISEYRFIIILILGLLAFIVPLCAAFSSKFNLGAKLSTGEVRKSIVISFTIIYIMLLCLSFDKTTDLATVNNTTLNIVTQGNITFSTLNNTTVFNGISTQTVPIQALGNFTQNFLYVYIIIIGFYFGSRLGERAMVLKYLQTLDSMDIARRRYAMGEIDSDTFNEMEKKLNGDSEPAQEKPPTPQCGDTTGADEQNLSQ
ncbi:MAG: hypothetical protein U9N61_12295 [Euryarchaeota archaeon]|nr:hypothetical protein [Euryarchaeota archaeon]